MKAPFFTDTVTLYNRYKDGRATHWKRTVLRGVQWNQKAVRTADNSGSVIITTETSVTVPGNMPGHVSPAVFAATENKSGAWTLAPDDMILFGENEAEITGNVTADDICALGAVTIRSVKDNTLRPRLKTWKVVAI